MKIHIPLVLAIEYPNEGTDIIYSSLSNYSLPANVENLTITDTALSGRGNNLANILKGNNFDNTLFGNNGADTLIGGEGNDTGGQGADSIEGDLGDDTYSVDNKNDVVTETSTLTTEIDSIQSSVSYTLGDNLENLSLIGAASINGEGNSLPNILLGNTSNNRLIGKAGNDTLELYSIELLFSKTSYPGHCSRRWMKTTAQRPAL